MQRQFSFVLQKALPSLVRHHLCRQGVNLPCRQQLLGFAPVLTLGAEGKTTKNPMWIRIMSSLYTSGKQGSIHPFMSTDARRRLLT